MALDIAVLALALAGATTGAQVQAVEQGQQKIEWAKDVDAEDLAECGVSFPISTTPIGPSVTQRFAFPGKTPVDVTFWRKPCDQDDAIVLVTVEPTGEGDAFFCGTELQIVQANTQSTSTRLALDALAYQSLCGSVRVPTTGWLNVRMPREFDHEDAFTVHSAHFQSGPARVSAYDHAAYSGTPGPTPGPVATIDDDFSGSWYHAGESVKNQGWFLEFSDDSHSPSHALAAWFTGNADGTALMWYTAHGSYQGHVATLKVYQTDNVTFGGNTGSTREVGSLKLTFQSCTTGTAEWQFQDGRTGSLPITRMIAEPDDCD